MKLAEQTAAKIEMAIAELGWPLGSVLGSEADLLARYGVSRAVLREAVRLLEHDNVARMRRGPGGGLVVAKPDPEAVTRTATLYLRYRAVDPGQIFDARIALEVAAVKGAAELIDEDGIARLRAALDAEPKPSADVCAPEFHLMIADLSGNPAIQLFVDVVTKLTTATAGETPLDAVPGGHRPERQRSVHEDIADAVVAGDVALAQHRMKRHLQAMACVLGSDRADGRLTAQLTVDDEPGPVHRTIDLVDRSTEPSTGGEAVQAVQAMQAVDSIGAVGALNGPLDEPLDGSLDAAGLSGPGAGSGSPRAADRGTAAGAATSRPVAASGPDARTAGRRPAARRSARR